MVIVFPMLVSRAVSENSIPAISKTLENYIIVNKQDELMTSFNQSTQAKTLGKMKRLGKELVIKEEDETLSEAMPPGAETSGHKKGDEADVQTDVLLKAIEDLQRTVSVLQQQIDDYDQKVRNATGSAKDQLERDKFEYQKKRDEIRDKQQQIKDLRDRIKDVKEKEKDEKKREEEKIRNAKIELKQGDMKSISLEPTYITMDVIDRLGNRIQAFVGVKVIPTRVNSDVPLSHLLLRDAQLNVIMAGTVALGRIILRTFYKIFDKWTRRFRILSGMTPSGDPRRDIIMGRTGMGKGSETFIVLNKQEDMDDFFLENASRVNRLYTMGWGNFIVADDIARAAYFCMSQYNGMCSAIPYGMMYQYLGQSKAYESMEDAKRANSSIFKIGPRFSKLIGECKCQRLLTKYTPSEIDRMTLKESNQVLMEDVMKLIPNIGKPFVNKLANSLDKNDMYGSIKKISKLMPSVKPSTADKLEMHLQKSYPEFKSMKQTASLTLKNSLPGLSDGMANIAGRAVAFMSLFRKKSERDKSLDKNLRDNIKLVVNKARKFGASQEYEEETADKDKPKMRKTDYIDIITAFVVIVITVIFLSAVLTGGYAIISSIYEFFTNPFYVGLAAIFGVVTAASWFLS